MAMRDDVELVADVLSPDGAAPAPGVLLRTAYGRQRPLFRSLADRLVQAGFVVVLQDVRGRHDSDGTWLPFFSEGRDGHDSVEWVARQPWCDGRVAMVGGSYSGWTQWAAASQGPESLRAMVSVSPLGLWTGETIITEGMLSLARFAWLHFAADRVNQSRDDIDWPAVLAHLPLATMDERIGRRLDGWRDWLGHLRNDDYWAPIVLAAEDLAAVRVPVLHVTGWFDTHLRSTLHFHSAMSRHPSAAHLQSLLVGPWNHLGTRLTDTPIEGLGVLPGADVDIDALTADWLQEVFDGSGEDAPQRPGSVRGSACTIYLVHEEGHPWRSLDAWPPDPGGDGTTEWFLHGTGAATSLGDGWLDGQGPSEDEPADTFVYDPLDPVPGAPLENVMSPPPIQMINDRTALEARPDVITYDSAVFERPLAILGAPELRLYVASDCPDTDVVVTLSDVGPDDGSVLVTFAGMRLRYRHGGREPVLLEPGVVECIGLSLREVAYVIRPGHRVRLSVTSSQFPVYDRNLNTGAPVGLSAEVRVATNTVVHDRDHPSRLRLRLLKPEDVGRPTVPPGQAR